MLERGVGVHLPPDGGLVEAHRKRGEDRFAVLGAVAVERFVHVRRQARVASRWPGISA
jgi:hypothetical protein